MDGGNPNWKPGVSANPVGRPKGVPNKLTRTIKAAFEDAFNRLQDVDPLADEKDVSLVTWARANPTDFYKLCRILIPQRLEHSGVSLNVITGVPRAQPEATAEDLGDIL